MNNVDLALTAFFLLGIYYGYSKGFIRQAVGLFGLFISFFAAYSFSPQAAAALQRQFPFPQEGHLPFLPGLLSMPAFQHYFYTSMAFLLLYSITRFLCSFLGRILHSFASLPILSTLNRGLGAFLGFLQILLIVTFAVYFVQILPNGKWRQAVEQSTITRMILQMSPSFMEKLPIQIERFPQGPGKDGYQDVI